MPRKPRTTASGLCHHVVHRGINRQIIFSGNSDRIRFLRTLERAQRRFPARLLSFCLMDNHYHLFVQEYEQCLSDFMKFVNGSYTVATNLCKGQDGAILRGRFFSRPVYTEQYAVALLRYIHLNPVVAGIVAQPDAYVWSSHRAYLSADHSDLLDCRLMLRVLAQAGLGPQRFAAWMKQKDIRCNFEDAVAVCENGKHNPTNLSFTREGVRIANEPEHDSTWRQWSAAEAATCCARVMHYRASERAAVLHRVAEQFGVSVGDLHARSPHRQDACSKARYVAAYFCRADADATWGEIAQELGIARQSVSIFLRRGRELAALGQ